VRLSRAIPLAGITAAAITVACAELTGPPSPLPLNSKIAIVDTVFASSILRAVEGFANPLPTPAAGAPRIPDSLLGKTLVLSCDSLWYRVSIDTSGPANGVRFVLYLVTAPGSMACAATPIGRLDLFDASTSGTTALRAVGSDLAANPQTYVDYTVSHAATDSPGITSASGWFTDGQQRLSFIETGGRAPGSYTAAMTAQLDDSAADVHESLRLSAQLGVDTYGAQVSFTVLNGTTNVALDGGYSWSNGLRYWNEVVKVNQTDYAKIGGDFVAYDSQPTLTPLARRTPFTDAERSFLLDLVGAPSRVSSDLGRLLSAGNHLVPGTP